MKILRIIGGMPGNTYILAAVVLDLEGQDFNIDCPIPVFMPVCNISLVDVDNETEEDITAGEIEINCPLPNEQGEGKRKEDSPSG